MTLTLTIPDEEAGFVKELLGKLGYKAGDEDAVDEHGIPAWHDEILEERVRELDTKPRIEWNEEYLRANREKLGF